MKTTAIILFLVACAAAASAYNARHDARNFGFVVFVYAAYAALVACRWWWDRREAAGEAVEGIKAAVWGLSTALSVGVVWWITVILPAREAVWLLAVVLCVFVGGLYGLVLFGSPEEGGGEKKKKMGCTEEGV